MSSGKLPFTAFVRDVLGVRLTRGQSVIARVAFDGLDPCDLTGEDRELARQIFGDVDRIPPEARNTLDAVCGARGGKTYVLSALRLLHLALTVDLSRLAPGEVAAGIIVAPDLRLARQCLRYALGAAQATSSIAKRIVNVTSDSFVIRRERGHSVSIECLPATRGGSAVRGRSTVGVVLDEAAFFRDADYLVNDTEIYEAASARVLPDGQVIIASTPWAETGLLYDMFKENHGKPTKAIAAHAPTLTLRDDDHTRAIVKREQERNPDNAQCEFFAEFMSTGSGLFFDPSAIDACIDDKIELSRPASVGMKVSSGGDFGFQRDSCALAIIGRKALRFDLLHLAELRPEKGTPLKPSAVVRSFAEVTRRYGCASLATDIHYQESIREHLSEYKLALAPAPGGADGKANVYLLTRKLVNEGRLRIPRHARLIAQMKSIVSKPTPGGGLKIDAPRRAGSGHGDLVSALTLAIWRASQGRDDADNDIPEPSFNGGLDCSSLGLEESRYIDEYERRYFEGRYGKNG